MDHTLPLDFNDEIKPHAAVVVFVWPLVAAFFYVTLSGVFLGLVP